MDYLPHKSVTLTVKMTPQIEIARIDPETGNDGQDIVDFVNTHFTTVILIRF